MSRGSRPGERRGGRQRGTPNKSTVLKNAAICAAASGPNSSPLDFLLGLMRDPNLPADLRVEMAKLAAPFVHVRKSKDQARDQVKARAPGSSASSRLRGDGAGHTEPHGNTISYPRIRNMEGKLNAASPVADADLSPLNYLLRVMNDPDAAPRLRIKAARIAAPYHLRAFGPPDERTIEIDDPFGFDCRPEAARALRDDQLRLEQLVRKRGSETASESPEETELRTRITRRAMSMECPEGYGSEQAEKDRERLSSFSAKRISSAPDNVLSEEEEVEEAHLTARLAAYNPEARNRRRIYHLRSKSQASLTATERSELEDLKKRYPDLPTDPDGERMARAIADWRRCIQGLEPVVRPLDGAQQRLLDLHSKSSTEAGLTAAERRELNELKRRYPAPNPNHPFARAVEAWRRALQGLDPVA